MFNDSEHIVAIFAIGPYDIIGTDNKLPWHSDKDFYFFKKATMNHPCIFGTTTFYNLPHYPLRSRGNIVCSRKFPKFQPMPTDNGTKYIKTNSIENAIKISRIIYPYKTIFVCGGASIYEYVIDKKISDVLYVSEIYSDALATDVQHNPEKYTYFPTDFRQDYIQSDVLNVNGANWPPEHNDINVKISRWIRKKSR